MLLLKSYIGVAVNETGSSRFPKIAIQKVSHSTLGLVACNSTKVKMFGTNKKELGNLSYPKTYKTFLELFSFEVL